MQAKIIGNKIVSRYTEEELKKMAEKNQNQEDEELLLESLNINLKEVQEEIIRLQEKEEKLKKQIDKTIHKE